MANFDVAAYNDLLMIEDAHERLAQQLGDDKKGRLDKLIDALSDLFLNGDEKYKFGICIMHRHYELNPGERMVRVEEDTEDSNIAVIVEPSTDTSPDIVATVQPSKDQSPDIVEESWMFDGTPFEHVKASPDSITRPSDDFFTKFRDICKGSGVNTLGITATRTGVLADDVYFLEVSHPDTSKDRTRNIERIKSWSPFQGQPGVQQTAWMPVAVSTPTPFRLSPQAASDKYVTMKCVHNCQEHTKLGKEQLVDADVNFKPAAVVGSRNANQL